MLSQESEEETSEDRDTEVTEDASDGSDVETAKENGTWGMNLSASSSQEPNLRTEIQMSVY